MIPITHNQFLAIVIATAFVFLFVGIYIGFLLANNQDKKLRKQVDDMDVTEIFKRHHGIKN